MAHSDNLLSVEEAAERLGVSPETVRRLCRQGKIKAERLGSQWIIDGDALPSKVRRRRRKNEPKPAVDLDKATNQVFRTDVRELWVPDPLRWEDYRKSRADLARDAGQRLANKGPFDPATIVNVPKTPLLGRPGYMLSIADRIAYHAAVSSFAPSVEASIEEMEKAVGRRVVFSARLSTSSRYLFQYWKKLWLSFKNSIDHYVDEGFEYMVRTDIVGYYEAIQHSLMFADMEARGADPEVVRGLRAMFALWPPIKGVGIPQGPDASRLIGNSYLVPIDQEMTYGHPWVYFRYMDDIRIMGRTRKDVVEGMHLLQSACRRRGLSLGTNKTVLLIGDDAKADLRQDGDLDRARYLFDMRKSMRRALPLLKKILKSALGKGGVLQEKKAKFSLWRLAQSRDSTMINRVMGSLEDLAPLAQIVAQFLQRFIRRRHVQEKIAGYLLDPSRNLSPVLSTWLLATCLDLSSDYLDSWVSYARTITFDGNRPPYQRVIAASVLARGRQIADIEALRTALIREFNPEMARGFLVALARVSALDSTTAGAVISRIPDMKKTVSYLRNRSALPSLIYPEETSPVIR